jgi:topoisomerase-4 subunit B
VLETPLFRVRNKQETIYCYSEAERDAAAAKLGGKPACVAEADAENEQAVAGQTQAQQLMQHTPARRRPEITRFKGLGEISPNEFKQFIGKEMRVRCLHTATSGIQPKVDSQQILTFYMGKNTPERKDYIMENLVVAVEE